jgi:hypothetical protein
MTSFKLQTSLVGQRLELPIQATMKVKPGQLIVDLWKYGNATVPTSLLLINPFGAPVVVHEVSLDIYYNNTRVGFAFKDTGTPSTIPHHIISYHVTQPLLVHAMLHTPNVEC